MRTRLVRWPGSAALAAAILTGVTSAQTPPASAETPPAAAIQTPPPPPSELFKDDVHAKAGMTCDSCHAGPAGGPYAAIARTQIAPLCARCHSDPASMRVTRPEARVDQHTLYLTSRHGQQMSKGETRVATCSDCHGSHGLQPVKDPRSPVAPRNVATTCGRCHGDETLMEAFDRYGSPPVDWTNSVHARALLEKDDLSAPTCSTCHGAHGPSPSMTTSLAVCAECHVREAELYTKSPKKPAFDKIEEPGCLTCHSFHEIEAPADAWVGTQDPSKCSNCHDDTIKGMAEIAEVAQGLGQLSATIDRARLVLTHAEEVGMLVDEGFAALREAEEQQVLARLNVHAFSAKPFTPLATRGVQAAGRAQQFGEEALVEQQYRRRGLAVATIFILGFLITLWVKIRRLPPVT
jgi:predicted CXXCH cytochrome family protein